MNKTYDKGFKEGTGILTFKLITHPRYSIIKMFVVIVLIWGPNPVVLRVYPWLFAQGSFLAGLGKHMRYWVLNPGLPCERQALYPLYYHPGPCN